VLYKSAYTQRAADHAQIERHLQPAVDRFKDLPEDKQQEIELRQASRLRQPMIIAIGHSAPFPADWWGRGGDRRAAVDSDHLAGIIWPGRNASARRQLRDPTVRSGLRELLETLDNTVDELWSHIELR